jgi:O-antigen ligase
MFLEKPFFGWGYNNFDVYDRGFYGRVLDLAHDNKDHASHNLYLTIIAEQGAAGLLLYLGPMLWLFALSIKRLPDLPRNGFRSRKLLILLWLMVLTQVVVSNFMNIIVVYGLGLWWVNLALIATLVDGRSLPTPVRAIGFKPTAALKLASPPSLFHKRHVRHL